jgi:hypothetical protein
MDGECAPFAVLQVGRFPVASDRRQLLVDEGAASGQSMTIQANRIVYAALAFPDKREERSTSPDPLRINDELVLLHHAPNAAVVAEDYLQQSLEWARRPGAPTSERHGATSPAWFWQRQRRTSAARRAARAS